ncbi:MAG: hypothetical protein KDB14_27790 [Planctomycetales bacterium]|nr:hypothetical protein [Planctomycetales bacterium]
MQITLEYLREAHAARDPDLANLFLRMTQQPEPEGPEPRSGSLTFNRFLAETKTRAFRRKPPEEQAAFRQQQLAALEAVDAENPLPPVLASHQFLWELWEAGDLFSRRALLEITATTPLVHGPFKGLKRIFKAAEAADDTELLGAIAAAFDTAFAGSDTRISRRTLGYLVRRAWRYLRRTAESKPAIFPDVATDFLAGYGERARLDRSWILNHLFYHELDGAYTRTKFRLARWDGPTTRKRPTSLQKYRAYDELWRRSPRPLFSLLERGRHPDVLRFAVDALKSDFRASLRDVEPEWVARLINAGRRETDEFVVWILDNVPKFEQAKFRELGLHESVLRLFESSSPKAQKYAAVYARTHARDLPNSQLIVLINSRNKDVAKLASDLITSRDPRKEVGLEVWCELLNTPNGHDLAKTALLKHFGSRELTIDWFAQMLVSDNSLTRDFAHDQLFKVHSRKQVGDEFFADLLDGLDADNYEHHAAAELLLDKIQKPGEISVAKLQQMLLSPLATWRCQVWVDEGKIQPKLFEAEYLKAIAYAPTFEQAPQVQSALGKRWGKQLHFSESTAASILRWLQDTRQFMPDDLGFEWLLELVQRSEPLYHDFAVKTLNKLFLPADFARTADTDSAPAPQAAKAAAEPVAVDLGGASFVFTGKLNTMSRGEAQGKVTSAGGANSSSVNKKLDYLVIGDDGSPLYGQGRKGSKQLKAESLNEDGAGIRIISETAFLQMLAGEQRDFSADDVEAGCERLWSMMVDAKHPETPLARFARSYIRQHHPEICLAETDRPVDPGAEIPPEFLSFDRFLPLFSSRHAVLREFALEMAHWELARWQPPIDGIVALCDSSYPAVREFITLALTADEAAEHRRYRIDPDVLTADAVYTFCESRIEETRRLGMELIRRHARLRVPEELFRLTESPDARVRAFVIRTFWSLYRDRGVKADWKPTPPAERQMKKRKDPRAGQTVEDKIGLGVPERPSQPPAGPEALRALLRRMLFELPPGRPPRDPNAATTQMLRLPALPARQGKLKLIETLRDLAVEEVEFAPIVLPLLREFKQSRGVSEQAACRVAVTRIEHSHPALT